jgi:hypothetical protein
MWVDFGDREFVWNSTLIEGDFCGYPPLLIVKGCKYDGCNGVFAISGDSLSLLSPLSFLEKLLLINGVTGERSGKPCYNNQKSPDG